MINTFNKCLTVLALSTCSNLWAVAVDEQLPAIEDATQLEEIRVEADDVQYVATKLDELQGKVLSIYHLAPRMGVDQLHKPFFDELMQQSFPRESFQAVTIANMDAAAWGTSGLVKSRFEDEAKTNPNVRFILDNDATVLNRWGLKESGAVVILVDAQGKILAVKEGEVKPEEVEPLLALIKAQF